MSSGTLGRVFYRVRPAKNIERKMICEALASLYRVDPLASYQYVGFGSLEFHDFALFYQRLGIGTMVSIEKRDSRAQRARVKFNRPYGRIAMKWGPSSERLPEISWEKRSIIWLDYDSHLDVSILEDVQFVVSQLRSGSCLIVTVCCQPAEAKRSNSNVGAMRLANLHKAVGRERIPDDVTGASLRKWGLGRASRRIVHNEIEATLSARNAPLSPGMRFEYSQIFNFHYADSATKMATFGGVLVSEIDRPRLSASDFEHLSFYRPGPEAYTIQIPRLTVREARWLSQQIPYSVDSQRVIPQKEVARYKPIHRYFPEFLEVEAV